MTKKRRVRPIEERCRDLAVKLMDDLSWDREGYVPMILWKAADEIELLRSNGARAILQQPQRHAGKWTKSGGFST